MLNLIGKFKKKIVLLLILCISNFLSFSDNSIVEKIIYDNVDREEKILNQYQQNVQLSYDEIVKNTQSNMLTYLVDEFNQTYQETLDKLPKKSKNHLVQIYNRYREYMSNKSYLYESTALNLSLNKDEANLYMYTNGYNVLESFIIFLNIVNNENISENKITEEFEKIKNYYLDSSNNTYDITSIYLTNEINKTYYNIENELINIKEKYKINDSGEKFSSWERKMNNNIKLVKEVNKQYRNYDKLVEKFIDSLSFNNNVKEELKKIVKIQELSNIQFMFDMIKDSKMYIIED